MSDLDIYIENMKDILKECLAETRVDIVHKMMIEFSIRSAEMHRKSFRE